MSEGINTLAQQRKASQKRILGLAIFCALRSAARVNATGNAVEQIGNAHAFISVFTYYIHENVIINGYSMGVKAR